MPRSYHIYDIITFDIEDILETTSQRALITDNGFDAPATSIRKTTQVVNNYEIYEGIHEVKVNKPGRTYGASAFDSFVGKNTFKAYYKPGDSWVILEGAGKVVKSALKALSRQYPTNIELKRGTVDFAYIKQHCDNIWGGWISPKNNTRLKSIGLFGEHVDLTQDYDSYTSLGTLNSMCVELTFEGETYSFMIGRERSVLFYQSENISEDLECLELLLPYLFGTFTTSQVESASTNE